MSIGIFNAEVTADIAMTSYWTALNCGHQIYDFMIKMKTHTAGAGQLLATIRYDDGEGPQDLNAALNLTAGNYIAQPFPNEWMNTAVDIQLGLTFLAAGGTCDVEIQVRNA